MICRPFGLFIDMLSYLSIFSFPAIIYSIIFFIFGFDYYKTFINYEENIPIPCCRIICRSHTI
jgi:hypothetical protein